VRFRSLHVHPMFLTLCAYFLCIRLQRGIEAPAACGATYDRQERSQPGAHGHCRTQQPLFFGRRRRKR
jgi:hypothetical protein